MFKLEFDGLSADIIKVLEKQGLPIRKSLSIEIPNFPEDITLVDDQELMVIASQYMENYNLLSTQVAIAYVAEKEAENDFDMAEAQALLSMTTGKATEKAGLLKAAVLAQPHMQDKLKAKSYTYAYRKLIETNKENLERYYLLVSRELTRRTSSGDRMKTNRYTP
jgi:hypothetical protein